MKDFLKKVQIFSKLSDDDLSFLENKIQIQKFSANEILFNEGDFSSGVYVIQSGSIEIFKKSNQRDILLAVRHEGELLGETSILEESTRTASARTKKESVLLFIDGKDFNSLLDHSPTATRGVFHSIMARWRSMESLLRTSEKMATLGVLTAGITHELFNPVSAIKSGAERLKGEVSTFIESQKKINLITLSSNQLEHLQILKDNLIEKSITPIQIESNLRSEREYELETWLENQGLENAYELAPALVNLDFTIINLLEVLKIFGPVNFSSVIQWLGHTASMYNILIEISSSSDRMSEIVKGLKEYSYLDQAPIQSIDLHSGIDNSLLILKSKAKSKSIIISKEYDFTIPKIQAFGSELNQVWTNLLDNSIDALAFKGEIKIKTKNHGQWISIEIQDNGEGIPEKIKHKIFDPFFTTKPPGKGTGLGLDISYRIITQKHYGDIQFFSKKGFTSFQIILPVNLEDVAKKDIPLPKNIFPVNDFFKSIISSTKSIAVVNVSQIEEQPNFYIPKFFIEKDYKVILIHPVLTQWEGLKVYKSLDDIKETIDLILLFESSDKVLNLVKQGITKKVKTIWMQEGIVNIEASEIAQNSNINVVMDKCLYSTWKRINEHE
jgi:signal transduction histidine kinase/predicted CoA-binding protein